MATSADLASANFSASASDLALSANSGKGAAAGAALADGCYLDAAGRFGYSMSTRATFCAYFSCSISRSKQGGPRPKYEGGVAAMSHFIGHKSSPAYAAFYSTFLANRSSSSKGPIRRTTTLYRA